MGDDTGQENSSVRASLDSFRRAGTAVSNGFRVFHKGTRAWVERRHSAIQFGFATAFWFAGNWVYNRTAPTVTRLALLAAERVFSGIEAVSIVSLIESNLVLASVQFLSALIAVVVGQNRIQTRRLKNVESILTTMTDGRSEATDGGARELPPVGGRALGGMIAGGAIGLSFGPGGVLAGMFLGFAWGDKLDIRAYERDPHTPDLNPESKAER